MKLSKKSLAKASRQELLALAKQASIHGYVRMKSSKIIQLLLEQASPPSQPEKKFKRLRKDDIIAPHQDEINETKYTVAASPSQPAFTPKHEDIPDTYGVTRIVLMVRDPFWLHTYWEITPVTESWVKGRIGSERLRNIHKVIKIMDVTSGNPDLPQSFWYVDLNDDARSWYFRVHHPDRSYCVEIGYLLADNSFFGITRSNTVHAPRAGMSDVFDEQWMSLEDYYQLYILSGGLNIHAGSFELMGKKGEVTHREYVTGTHPVWI